MPTGYVPDELSSIVIVIDSRSRFYKNADIFKVRGVDGGQDDERAAIDMMVRCVRFVGSGAMVALLCAGPVWAAGPAGQWIGCDSVTAESVKAQVTPAEAKPAPIDTAGTKWIWQAEGAATAAAPGIRYFRKRLVLDRGKKIRRAQVLITADDKFTLRINGKQAASGSSWNELQRVDVAKLLKPGENRLEVEAENGGDEPNPAGLLAKLMVIPEAGDHIVLLSDTSWEVSAARETGYAPAKIVGPMGCKPWGNVGVGGAKKGALVLPPAKYLRKPFSLKGKVKKATLKASALGWYEIRLNGERVGEDYFAPGWTDYQKRVYYNTYDVTDMLDEGDNAIGAVVADGWYAGYIGYRKQRDNYGGNVRVNAELVVEYTDGSIQAVVTDDSWRGSGGPILEADILMGELYDATREMDGWDETGFDDQAWLAVDVTETIGAKVEPYPAETVQVFREIEPLSVSEPKPGVFVFDMGANFAGVARLKVKGERGTRVTLAFGERLLADGTILKQNLRTARAEDTYVCKGEGVEVWEPRFTFHGFQYVSVTGFPGTPDKDAVTGIELTSATEVVGSFACSDERLNKLYRNIIQTQRANFIDIPTDCPQRDERLGWTGDAQAYVRTACLNMDVKRFFGKWLVDLMDAQFANGDLPKVAPLKVAGGSGGPAWADAGIICPWAIYEVYGDKAILEKHYDAMARFMAFRANSMKNFMPPARFHCFGDWLSIGAKTPKDVIFSAYTAGDARIMAQVATVLGKDDDAQEYRALYENIKAAFNAAYVGADGRVKGDTQTCYVMALGFDLVDGEMKEKAEAHLIERIKARNWHLSTGFVGTRDLMHVLTKIGRSDVAYRLLFTDTYPSWLFPVKNGATSIWERWDSWTPEKGFQNPGMNSFSHYAYGAVGQWMFENIGGIRSAAPGYEKVVIKPVITHQLDWAKVSYKSVRGRIAVEWQRAGDKVDLVVEVPSDTVAQIFVPGREKAVSVKGGRHRFKGSM